MVEYKNCSHCRIIVAIHSVVVLILMYYKDTFLVVCSYKAFLSNWQCSTSSLVLGSVIATSYSSISDCMLWVHNERYSHQFSCKFYPQVQP